jgi:succinyl-CoA synthetase alpha subunit
MTSTAARSQPPAADQAAQGGQPGRARRPGLTALFAPRRIAVVGASRSPGKLGAVMARSLRGFAAGARTLALVNGRDEEMYSSVGAAAADGPVDLAVICVPAPACPGVLAEAAGAGAAAAVICGGGFAEAGGPGAALQRELSTIVAATGIRLLGPNTSGFIVPPAGLAASFVPGATAVRPGRIAVVAASGGVNHTLAFGLTAAGHGVSLAVGLGNAADVTAADVLDYLAGDPATGAVALHVESVRDGRRLVDAVRRLTQRVPSGRGGDQPAAAHRRRPCRARCRDHYQGGHRCPARSVSTLSPGLRRTRLVTRPRDTGRESRSGPCCARPRTGPRTRRPSPTRARASG